MKNLPLFTAVFLLIFLGGLGIVLLQQPAGTAETKKRPSGTATESFSPAGSSAAPIGLPPLPHICSSHAAFLAEARRCPENSWEYSGEIPANFVSARGQLSSWFQNLSWRPEKQITLDASLKPQILLTFTRQEYELTLLLWKIKTNLTGFSYRRDKKSDFKGEIIQ